MNRIRSALARTFALSPRARAFFYVTAAAHVALKLLLGLTLVIEDRYGFRSLLAPPQSLVFAGGDVAVCFGFAKLLDVVVHARHQRVVQTLLLAPLFAFLVTNFIVHTYFKAFVNRGLLEFNGAGATEITDYTIAGLTPYSLSFSLFALTSFVTFALMHERVVRSKLVAVTHAPTALFCASLAAMGYVGTLSAGQSGWLAKNPAFELVRSYTVAQAHATTRATADEAKRFADPRAPLFGRYDTKLDVRVPSQRGKNVLFVLIESLPFEQTPLGGARGGLTVLDELARDAVVFDNFHTVFPATSRSFLTYHCGIYPTAGDATATKYEPNYRCDSLLDGLKGAGYRTGFFTAPMFTYDNLHKAALIKGYDVYEDFLSLRERAKKNAFDAPAVEEEAVAGALLDFVRADRAKPFFATYFMFWNHAPYRLPFSDISKLPALERYHKTLDYLDGVLRDVLHKLEADGVLRDTVVVVAADHGEGFGIHHGNTNHVGHIYEDDVRIPLLVHVPGLGAHRTSRLGSNVDFAPTLASLLELPRASSWQGQDLLGKGFEPRPLLLFGRASFATNGILDGNLKYIEYVGTEQRMLYDVLADPTEQNNLLPRESAKAERYHSLLERWLPVVDYRAWAVSGR